MDLCLKCRNVGLLLVDGALLLGSGGVFFGVSSFGFVTMLLGSDNIEVLLVKQASSSLLLAFASKVILGIEPHRDQRPSKQAVAYCWHSPAWLFLV
jgi:hypothetical protein